MHLASHTQKPRSFLGRAGLDRLPDLILFVLYSVVGPMIGEKTERNGKTNIMKSKRERMKEREPEQGGEGLCSGPTLTFQVRSIHRHTHTLCLQGTVLGIYH